MTINECVSDLIHSEIADFFAGFGSPGEPDIQNGDAQRLLSARIDAVLQQYRAAAEPVAVVLSNRAGNDTSTIDKALPAGTALYTMPPAPEEAK